MLEVSTRDADCFEKLRAFSAPAALSGNIAQTVAEIIADVQARGDEAVLYYTAKFDHAKLHQKQIRVPQETIDAAFDSIEPEKLEAMKASAASISDFHKRTLPKNWKKRNPHGAVVGELFFPIHRVGLYIPGGQVPQMARASACSRPVQS